MTGLDKWNFKKTTNCNETPKNERVGNTTHCKQLRETPFSPY